MDAFFNNLRKVTVGIITGIFAFVLVYIPQPFVDVPEAEAFPVIEIGFNSIKENILDPIAFAVAKSILSEMISSTIVWINNGFEGSPAFVQDLDGFLLDAADRGAGEYIASLGEVGSFICSPFRLDIQIALSLSYQAKRDNRPIGECRLSEVVGNIEDFLAGDFTSGGWDNFITVTTQPEYYTPYGQRLTAEIGLNQALARQAGIDLEKLNWGGGFLSTEICELIEGPSKTEEHCVIATPGRTIADSLNKALGAGQDQLIAADEINELVGALLGQLANQAITGAAGLLGLSAGTGYNGDSYINAVRAEGNDLIKTGKGLQAMTESLGVQKQYQALATEYAQKLTNYAADTSNDAEFRQEAATAAAGAFDIVNKSSILISLLEGLLETHAKLETEYNATDTTDQRKTAIRQEQLEVLSSYAGLVLYTSAEINTSRDTWQEILRQ